jgi:signal transduction histidine kinase
LAAPKDEALVNARLLRQAFTNLIFTAVVATPTDGRIRVLTRVTGGEGEPPVFELAIEDGGACLEGEEHRRFFDPRWVSPGRGKGMGLGLYLGREILVRHGARLEVLPLDGSEGRRVTIQLPLEGGSEDEVPIQLKEINNLV